MFPNMQINSLKLKKGAGGYRGRRNPYDIPMCPLPGSSNAKRSIGSRSRITRSILSQRTNSRERSLKGKGSAEYSPTTTIHACRPPTTSYQNT